MVYDLPAPASSEEYLSDQKKLLGITRKVSNFFYNKVFNKLQPKTKVDKNMEGGEGYTLACVVANKPRKSRFESGTA
jgi:hypothetical protein